MDQELNFNENDLEKNISDYLFNAMKDIKVHRLNDGNMILDIDYKDVVDGILKIIKDKNTDA